MQEILHDALTKAWEAQSRGACPRDPVGWLFVIALNTARDHRRRKLRQAGTLSLEEIPVVDHPLLHASPEAALECHETLEIARLAIHALPEEEREVFVLRTSADMTFAATAALLEIPVGTAKTRMRSALRKLRGALRKHGPDMPSSGTPTDTTQDRDGTTGRKRRS